jgi:putative transposase
MMARCGGLFPIRMICRLLQVSPSRYSASQKRPLSRRAGENAQLTRRFDALHSESEGVCGSPKLWQKLQGRGHACSKHRVPRLMKQEGLQGIPARKHWRRGMSGKRPQNVTNNLAREFGAETPNTKWVSDITSIRTAEGWLYLALLILRKTDELTTRAITTLLAVLRTGRIRSPMTMAESSVGMPPLPRRQTVRDFLLAPTTVGSGA